MSRLKSGRGASGGSTTTRAAAPQRGGGARGGGGVFVQTPRSDIFVAMLGIALAAIVVGTLLLVLVLNRYEFKTKATAMLAPAAALQVA